MAKKEYATIKEYRINIKGNKPGLPFIGLVVKAQTANGMPQLLLSNTYQKDGNTLDSNILYSSDLQGLRKLIKALSLACDELEALPPVTTTSKADAELAKKERIIAEQAAELARLRALTTPVATKGKKPAPQAEPDVPTASVIVDDDALEDIIRAYSPKKVKK